MNSNVVSAVCILFKQMQIVAFKKFLPTELQIKLQLALMAANC